MPTVFNAQWDYRVYGGTGADGTSFNYGPMTGIGNDASIIYEKGMSGAVLVVSFIEHLGERVELRYNGDLLASKPFTLVNPSYRRVVVDVSSTNSISISVGGSMLISTDLSGYDSLTKTGWRFGFAARTGAANNEHSIDNLAISGL